MSFLANKFPASGNANTLVAGTRISGNGVTMGRVKPPTLCAKVDVDIETASLTLAVVWQGANASDFSDAVDLAYDANNPTAVVVGTGTGGADAAISKAFPCPASGYAFKYVRLQLLTAGATGNTVDTYAIGYFYRAN